MPDRKTFYITTAIDYPNSTPHVGTAFEKLGADVQARYRRMEGYDVFFLMGNDENTVKVARRAAELGKDVKPYCDEMAGKFKESWASLKITYDDFIQTSEGRHHAGCRQFIQSVYDNGHIYKDSYEGLYCDGCEAFKTEKELEDGQCPTHKTPAVRRTEPCYKFRLSSFQQQLLDLYESQPGFIQPESRRNEVLAFVRDGLHDLNITRTGEDWGIKVPFDEGFTIYVWFDALLNYITAIGYGTNDDWKNWWPADIHFIGKDITRFHCVIWPAMLLAAGAALPKSVFGHGFLTVEGQKMSKTLGNVIPPEKVIAKHSVDGYRWYFMRECPFPGDGDFSWDRFREVINTDLANNLGNLYSRVVKLVSANYDAATLPETADRTPAPVDSAVKTEETVAEVRRHVEACHYQLALQKVVEGVLDPANIYAESNQPWKLVKTDKDATRDVLFNLVEPLRVAAILLKPFIPNGAETIYRSFNFSVPWEAVSYGTAASPGVTVEDMRILAELQDGKVKPLFPRVT